MKSEKIERRNSTGGAPRSEFSNNASVDRLEMSAGRFLLEKKAPAPAESPATTAHPSGNVVTTDSWLQMNNERRIIAISPPGVPVPLFPPRQRGEGENWLTKISIILLRNSLILYPSLSLPYTFRFLLIRHCILWLPLAKPRIPNSVLSCPSSFCGRSHSANILGTSAIIFFALFLVCLISA